VGKTARVKFGKFVRQKREAKQIGLREMARMIRVSPTYLSKIERDEFPPPAEDKIKAIADILNLDADNLLRLADKVPSDLTEIIKYGSPTMIQALRGTVGMSNDEKEEAFKKIVEHMKKRNIPKFR
jgi:transcriptional regulator with XRE-family HTH domain